METQIGSFTDMEACRTCGIYYINIDKLKPIFGTSTTDSDMSQIQLEFSSWNLKIYENDGYPQSICKTCIYNFKELRKFRQSCISTQNQFREISKHKVPIKTELEFLDLHDDLSSRRFLYEYDDNENDEIPSTTEEFIAATATTNEIKPVQIEENHSYGPRIANQFIILEPFKQDMEFLDINNEIMNEPLENLFEYNTEAASPSLNELQYLNESENQYEHEIRNSDYHICGEALHNCVFKAHGISENLKCPQCDFCCSSKALLNEHTSGIHSKISSNVCEISVFPEKFNENMMETHMAQDMNCMKCNINNSVAEQNPIRLNNDNASDCLLIEISDDSDEDLMETSRDFDFF